MDAIELEVLWGSLISTVNEQAKALQRSAFSPIVREAGDLANALFDRRGRMVAQAVTGTPGHINSLARGGECDPRRVPARHPRAGRRARHQRPVQDRRPAARRDRPHPRVAQRADHRVLRLDDPPHRRRWVRHRGRRPRRLRRGPVDPDQQADARPASATTTCGSSSSPTFASPSTWPVTCTPRWPRARSARSGSTCSSTRRPRRHRGARRGDRPAVRGSDPTRDPGAARRDVPGGVGARPRRRLRDRDPGRGHRRPGPRRDPRRLRGLVRREPGRHQRGEELHARLHDLHDPQRAEPRGAEQLRQPAPDRRGGARGQHRQRRLPRTVHGTPRRGHVPADAAAPRSPRSSRRG